MDYVVAIDPQRKISNGYLTAYKQRGIPTAFIVDQKLRVVWVGHPMSDLEAVLEEIVAGEFDTKAYTAKKEQKRNRDAKAKSAMREAYSSSVTVRRRVASPSISTATLWAPVRSKYPSSIG